MAAYAALVSVMHIIDNLQHHSRPPISLHKEQVHLLTQKINFLEQFLQVYNPNLPYREEANLLESRITRAAYAAEDAIESHILDHFRNNDGEKMSSDGLYEALEKVIEDMALIEKEAMEIKETSRFQNAKSMPPDSSRSSSSSLIAQKKCMMVGADDLLLEMKSKLTADARDLQTLPIVGMGGSGKTTLALNIYQDRLIKEHFDICAWATISQEYSSVEEKSIDVLRQLNNGAGPNMSVDDLGGKLYKLLYGRRYLIILDDMWSIDVWDRVRSFFPNNKNGSKIIVTTRLSNLALDLTGSESLTKVSLLDEANSWELLSETVFGRESCPLEFVEIGKKIGKSCKGLPLSIVVVGGLLAKSKHTVEFWEYIEENLNSIVNSHDNDHCLKILYMSYNQLQVHLRPCFLYVGVFREDQVIRVSRLIKLWVSEGFLKPIAGKSLEEVAIVYLKDLIDRNLISIDKIGSTGNIKYCKVHDLLRDLCLREAQKEGFYSVVPRACNLQGAANAAQRRIVIHSTTSKNEASDTNDLSSSASLARSLTLDLDDQSLPQLKLNSLLRIFNSTGVRSPRSKEFLKSTRHLVNSRFLAISVLTGSDFPSSIWRFWNLQTLIVNWYVAFAPTDIWLMPHIRHIYFEGLHLPEDARVHNGIVLGNLQTLGRVMNLNYRDAIKRIPNIKKLQLSCESLSDRCSLTDLDCLHQLESLSCSFPQGRNPSGPDSLRRRMSFPHSLKKLNLSIHPSECWQGLLDKIGSLPLLQKLKLKGGRFEEGQWETSEGRFHGLKFLSVSECKGLELWKTESSHFRSLERLRVSHLWELKEIPLDFAEISTLRVIEVYSCSNSAVESGKRILEEQVALHGEEGALQVQVR